VEWSAVWNLPVPLDQVRVTESAIRHIFNEHMVNSWEHWESLLSTPLMGRLEQCWGRPDAERFPVLDEVSALLEPAVRQGVERPLFLTYDQLDERRALLHRTCEVVAPSGHVFVIRLGGAVGERRELKTALLPYESLSERPSRRWLGAVRSRVELYCAPPWLIAERHVYALPSATHEVSSEDPPGWRTNIHFEAHRVWDFREFTPPGRQEALIVWGTRPLPWPDRQEPGGTGAGAGVLKKRKSGGK
jgi:hypothetical protein